MEQIPANIPENDKPKMQTLTKLFEKLTKAETGREIWQANWNTIERKGN